MITITATEKATHQQQCKWLRPPRGVERGIIKVPANRHSLYFRASNIGTTQRCSNTHNFFFICDSSYDMGRGCIKKQGIYFQHKKQGACTFVLVSHPLMVFVHHTYMDIDVGSTSITNTRRG